jgi:aryl-alcohol dehydrogenase-like predicted oxidoreductase
MNALWTSKTEHLARFVTLQAEYSLMARDLEREHVPLCQQMGLGILPWSPLAGGFLSGKYDKTQPPPDGTRLAKMKERYGRFDNERGWRTIGVVKEIAAEHGTTAAAVSLAWVLSKPIVTSAIFGARDLAQLEANVKAAELSLSAEQLQRLDDASAVDPGYSYNFMKNIQGRW